MILVTHFACCHQYKGYWRSCPLGWSYFTVMPGLNLRAGGAHAPEFTLNDALQQYADLKTQSAEFDPDELQDARLDLRPAMERSVVDRVQSAYGDKYDYLMMYDSKRDVADILHEETEARSIREHLRQKQQAQQKQNKKNSRDTWER